jgi:hypothetical protein
MLTRAELDSLYRANRHVVRRRLRAWRQLQPADREDVEQKMWLKLVTSKTAERRESNVAFLKRCANNAAKSFIEARNAQKNDADKTDSLGDEVVADTSFDFRGIEEQIDARRTMKQLHAIAHRLPAREAKIFALLMDDYDAVPAKERNRCVAALKRLLEIPATPASVERPRQLDAATECARTVRRLRLVVDDDAREDDVTVDELDDFANAAE